MHRVSVPGSTVAVIGAGASALVGVLAADRTVIAVDIADAALDVLRNSLEPSAPVSFIAADVRELQLETSVDAWHDRAVFHFLTTPVDQRAYVQSAAAAVRVGGHCVIASFAPDGPSMCSGLPTAQHDAESFRSLFAPAFELVESFTHDHVTPWDSIQRFTYAVLRRV
jgi:threonine dehydrogenase-like Zn-dependent dehydrogenase